MAQDEAPTIIDCLVELSASSSNNDKQDGQNRASFEWKFSRYIYSIMRRTTTADTRCGSSLYVSAYARAFL